MICCDVAVPSSSCSLFPPPRASSSPLPPPSPCYLVLLPAAFSPLRSLLIPDPSCSMILPPPCPPLPYDAPFSCSSLTSPPPAPIPSSLSRSLFLPAPSSLLPHRRCFLRHLLSVSCYFLLPACRSLSGRHRQGDEQRRSPLAGAGADGGLHAARPTQKTMKWGRWV